MVRGQEVRAEIGEGKGGHGWGEIGKEQNADAKEEKGGRGQGVV